MRHLPACATGPDGQEPRTGLAIGVRTDRFHTIAALIRRADQLMGRRS
jgi:hypothetical protein